MRSIVGRAKRLRSGAERPSYLPFHRPVPDLVDCGRTAHAGDGRSRGRRGVHARRDASSDDRRDGAQDSQGRRGMLDEIPRSIPLGIIFHTVLVDDADEALTMGKAMAAGYYEYSPMLFEPSGLTWDGPDPEALKARNRVSGRTSITIRTCSRPGRAVDFLSEAHADAFCVRGTTDDVTGQIVGRADRSGIVWDRVRACRAASDSQSARSRRCGMTATPCGSRVRFCRGCESG